jgi:hypothetical protein
MFFHFRIRHTGNPVDKRTRHSVREIPKSRNMIELKGDFRDFDNWGFGILGIER